MYDFENQRVVEPPRQFTGVWIPKEVLLDDRLTGAEKILYAEIASFGDKGCWKRSKELMKLAGVRTSTFQASCRKLVSLGYITQKRQYGRMVRWSNLGFGTSRSTPHNSHQSEIQRDARGEIQRVHIDNTKDNTKDNTTTGDKLPAVDEVPKKEKDDEIARLYYQVIKALSLPVANHNTVRAKIAEMKRTYTEQVCIDYLTFMRDKYSSWETKYKPQVSNALDVYTKSRQIMSRLWEDNKEQEVF
nr:MAG TPA: helix-turn-helix domain protein [Caudoviricetes sp.]